MKIKPLKKILEQLKKVKILESFDLVVGITKGGIVPSYLVSSYLKLPLEFIWINFRDKIHEPIGQTPRLIKPVSFIYKNKKILLVDDRSNSGKTLDMAKKNLTGAKLVKTLVVNGKADYPLFDEECFQFPWDI